MFGSDELKREVLTKIVSGEVVCSLGYSEPSCGSDVFAAQTRATRDGEGWRIDGSKMFTSGANIADYVLMLTRTNPDVPKHKGLTMFIVPLKSPGVSIQPVFTFQDERTNITYYDGVKVKDSYRLGAVDGGTKVMAGALEMEHGGGFSKSQRHMVHAAEELVSRDSISRTAVDRRSCRRRVRLARSTAHALLSEVIAYRAVWAATQKHPNVGLWTDGEVVLVGEVPEGLGRSAESHGAVLAVQAHRPGGVPQPVLSARAGHDRFTAAPARSIAV